MEARNSLTNFNQIYFMLTEQAAALQILMNEDLYLTANDLVWKEKPAETVLVEEPVSEILKEPKPTFNFIGKNLKNFLILTDQQLNENQLKALENTLARKQMTFDEVAVVDFSAYPTTKFEEVHAFFMLQKLVCFGLKPANLGLEEVTLNKIHQEADYQILYTFSFNEMLGNKEKTKAFWEAMKTL
jgi:hypothetical protein